MAKNIISRSGILLKLKPEAGTGFFHSIPLFFFLLMFCLVLGFEITSVTYSPYDQKRVIQLITFVLLVLALLVDRGLIIRINHAWSELPAIVRRGILLIAVLGAISSYLAPLPKQAFQEWSLFGLLFVFTLYIQTQLSSFTVQKTILALLAVTLCLYGWRFLAGAYLPGLFNRISANDHELFVGFVHPRFYNQIQSWTLPLLPALPVVFGGLVARRYRLLLWVPGIISWVLLFASGGRATLIAMVLSAAVVFVLFNRKSRSWLKTHVIYFIGGLTVYLALFSWLPQVLSTDTYLPKVTQRLVQDGLMGRDRLWGLALQIIQSHPVIGLGPQQYANYDYHAIAAHPHSAPLQWASEWGLVSFVILCSMLMYGFIKWVKFCKGIDKTNPEEPKKERNVLLVGLTACLVAGATHSLVSGVIVMPFSQMLMCLIVGWVLSIYHGAHQSGLIAPALTIRFQYICVAAVLLGTIGYTSYPGIINASHETKAFLIQHPKDSILKPRFWNQGIIGWR